MEILELKLRVSGHPTLDQSTKEYLMAGEAFRPLPHSSHMRLLGQVAPGSWLTAQVQNSAVFLADDWVVSIHGKNLIHCVSAMSVLLNSIGQELDSPVAVDLLTHQNGSAESLYRLLDRQAKRNHIIGIIKWEATIVVSATVGALLQRLFQWLPFGGLLP